jgi:magnesium transporter
MAAFSFSVARQLLAEPPRRPTISGWAHRITTASAASTARFAARRHYASNSFSHSAKDGGDTANSNNSNSTTIGNSNISSSNDDTNMQKLENDARDGAYSTTIPWGTPEESVEAVYAVVNDGRSPASATPDAAGTAAPQMTGAEGGAKLVNTNTNASAEEDMPLDALVESAASTVASGSAESTSATTAPHHESHGRGTHAEAATSPASTSSSSLPPPQPAAAGGSSYHVPWDDMGVGLVRRRVAQWYVPGLEREHRSTAGGASSLQAKTSTAAAEAGKGDTPATVGAKDNNGNHDHPARAASAECTAAAPSGGPVQGGGRETTAKESSVGAKDTQNNTTPSDDDVKPIAATALAPVGTAAPATGVAETAATTTRAVSAATHVASSTTSSSLKEHGTSASASPTTTSMTAPPAAAPAAVAAVSSVSAIPSKPPATSDKGRAGEVAEGKEIECGEATAAAAAAAAPPSSKAPSKNDKAGDHKSQRKDKKGNDDDGDDGDAELPKTLLSVQANRNKRLKRLLIAGLGSDFAKAGLSNDGVRTSFSVVNYQTIKQLTGLSHIPSALLISCLLAPGNEFSWIDISMHPTATLSEYKAALEEVLVELGMHRTMVEDSAEPMLLPQVTVTKGCYSLLMRYAIEAPANKQMDSFQDLTNRFTVFLLPSRIITVHRTQCSYVEELKLNWQHHLSQESLDAAPHAHRDASGRFAMNKDTSPMSQGLRYLMYYFVKETVGTFTQAIAKCIVEFDCYEANLFNTQHNRSSMARDIYHIKRRASVYGRTLTLTQDAYAHIATALHISTAQVGYQEIMHDLAHVESLAEELNSNADSVLQLLFQLSSYQVNELMRVLTLFSAFFIPLSFIASVYGMNFDDLPMLHNEHGGVFCAVLMCTVATCIFLWFRSNRFL